MSEWTTASSASSATSKAITPTCAPKSTKTKLKPPKMNKVRIYKTMPILKNNRIKNIKNPMKSPLKTTI